MNCLIDTKKVYTEVDAFIELLNDNYKNKIPKKLRDFFKNEKDNNYIMKIDPNKPIKSQNLNGDTLSLIAFLNLKYWCEDENEKQRLINKYAQNEENYQKKLKNLYNIDKVLENNKKRRKTNSEELSLIKYNKKETMFKKFIKFLKKMFLKH